MSDTTYDNSSNANDMEAEDGFASSMLTFAAIMTLLIMVVGIFGNFLTVAALIKCPKVRNVAAAFIMSLCIADLLFCALVLPFNAYRFIEGTWEPRDVLCKMIPFIQYGNIGVSLLCIAMITINRYVMIAHHSSYGKIYKRHWIAAMIIFCWVFSYGMQLPTLVGAWGTFGYDKKLGTCSILEDDHGHSSKTTLFVTAFVIPCIIIIACYTKIFWVVHKSEQRLKRHANKQNSIPNNLRTTPVATGSNVETGNGQSRVSSADSSSFSTDVKHESVQKQTTRVKDQREVRAKRNEWRITKMVLAIFLSFVICYLPITIAKVADQDVEHPNFHILSYIMLYMSACINPIIYVIMNKQYRKAYKTVIMCQPGRLLPFGKHAGGGGNNGSSVAEMERYRIEPHVAQSHNGFGSGPTKYQLQQFRPIASYGTEQQTERNKNKRYDRINTGDVAGSRVHIDSDIYREREQARNSEHRRTSGGAIEKRTNAHSHSCPESQQEYQYHQQQQPKRTSQPSNEYHNAKDHQTNSPGGRRYNFGGRGGRRGGAGAGSETDDRKSVMRREEKRTDDNANINATSTVHCGPTADTSVRECECIAPEEKPILRSEHQRHSR